jgi:hypothetical protein
MGLNFIRHCKNFQLLASPAEQNQRMLRLESEETQMEICIRLGNKVLFKGYTNGKVSRAISHHADAQADASLSQKEKRYAFRLQGNFEQIGKLF